MAVAVHNLIDFAIFEPGVLTTLWAIIACLVATNSQASPRPQAVISCSLFSKMIVVTAGLAMSAAYLGYVLVPVAGSTARIQRANRAISAGQYEYAHQLLGQASEDDPLSAAAPTLSARLYVHSFAGLAPNRGRDVLLWAAECLQAAIDRNDAAFNNFERLMDAYGSLAEISTGTDRTHWLSKAFDTGLLAIERYPGCGRLHYKLAQISERADKADVAIKHYRKAIEIENQYRDQFRRMYPDRKEVVSRLGEQKYEEAIKRIELLSKQPLP
jgi:tetratricopeptide (TPR) repeat protein